MLKNGASTVIIITHFHYRAGSILMAGVAAFNIFTNKNTEIKIKQEGQKSSYNDLGKTSPYIFGKINNAYTLQLGFGKEQMRFPALMDGNMSVSIRYLAGPSLAMLKPYYLKLIYVDYFPEP